MFPNTGFLTTHSFEQVKISKYTRKVTSSIFKIKKSRRLRWAGHVARMEESRSAFKILTGKPIGKRPLWRSRRRWKDIRMDLEELLMRGKRLIRLKIRIIGEPL